MAQVLTGGAKRGHDIMDEIRKERKDRKAQSRAYRRLNKSRKLYVVRGGITQSYEQHAIKSELVVNVTLVNGVFVITTASNKVYWIEPPIQDVIPMQLLRIYTDTFVLSWKLCQTRDDEQRIIDEAYDTEYRFGQSCIVQRKEVFDLGI